MGSTPKSLSCCGAPLQEFKLFFYVYFFTRLTTGQPNCQGHSCFLQSIRIISCFNGSYNSFNKIQRRPSNTNPRVGLLYSSLSTYDFYLVERLEKINSDAQSISAIREQKSTQYLKQDYKYLIQLPQFLTKTLALVIDFVFESIT